jgi:hypothetical protein
LICAIAIALPTVCATAGPLPDGGVTAAELAQVMQDEGYRAKISRDDEGDPKIESASGGYQFVVFFYGCSHTPRCSSVQFYSGWHVDGGFKIEDINIWNRSKRFGKAYVDKEKDPNIEMDLDLEHGATTEALKNDLETWDLVVSGFSKWIDCAGRAASDPCRKDLS